MFCHSVPPGLSRSRDQSNSQGILSEPRHSVKEPHSCGLWSNKLELEVLFDGRVNTHHTNSSLGQGSRLGSENSAARQLLGS